MTEYTVEQFIEFLKTQDKDAIVEVLSHEDRGSYYEQGGTCAKENFDPAKHVEHTDFRGNQFVKPSAPHFNKRYILIGSSDSL